MRGGDDFGEVGLERIGLHGEAQRDVDDVSASGPILGQALVAGPLAPLPIIAQAGSRPTREGGADVPTTWTAAPT